MQQVRADAAFAERCSITPRSRDGMVESPCSSGLPKDSRSGAPHLGDIFSAVLIALTETPFARFQTI